MHETACLNWSSVLCFISLLQSLHYESQCPENITIMFFLKKERKSSPESILVFPGLTISSAPSQGDRGEVGPPGPAGFAGPPVSKVSTVKDISPQDSSIPHQLIDILLSTLLCLHCPGFRWSAWCQGRTWWGWAEGRRWCSWTSGTIRSSWTCGGYQDLRTEVLGWNVFEKPLD